MPRKPPKLKKSLGFILLFQRFKSAHPTHFHPLNEKSGLGVFRFLDIKKSPLKIKGVQNRLFLPKNMQKWVKMPKDLLTHFLVRVAGLEPVLIGIRT